jgi:hypothetical protein
VLAERAGVPEALRPRYEALSIIPPDTPLPMTMLRRLWGLPCDTDAEATANLLESKVGFYCCCAACDCYQNLQPAAMDSSRRASLRPRMPSF